MFSRWNEHIEAHTSYIYIYGLCVCACKGKCIHTLLPFLYKYVFRNWCSTTIHLPFYLFIRKTCYVCWLKFENIFRGIFAGAALFVRSLILIFLYGFSGLWRVGNCPDFVKVSQLKLFWMKSLSTFWATREILRLFSFYTHYKDVGSGIYVIL